MLTACLRGISQVCLCQIPFQQESAEIGKCVDVIVEADIAAGKLDAAVNVVILLTGNQCTGGFCRAVFALTSMGISELAVLTKKSCSSVESSRLCL